MRSLRTEARNRRYPVPMKFAQERMEAKIAIHLLSELDKV